MAGKRTSSAPSSSAEHPLAAQLDRVGDELRLIRNVLDEIRTDLEWAVQNGRIQVGPDREAAPDRLAPVTLFDEGDAVEVDHNRLRAFGEVMAVNDAENTATVLLIPSNDTITVPQDSLRRVEPDRLRRLSGEAAAFTAPLTKETSQCAAEPAAPGSLF